MGSRLALEVSDNWGHLPAGPYKVLMRMALKALDSKGKRGEAPEHYYRGWVDLAAALGRQLPDRDDESPEANRKRKTVKDEIRRYTNCLIDAGAVKRLVDNPGGDTKQSWRLTL